MASQQSQGVDEPQLTWLDKILIAACSLALAAIFGTAFLLVAVIAYWLKP